MNYYKPRELKGADGKSTGLWHYTVQNDNRIWPTGYCANGCAGHDTEEGAREHYKEYLLDTARYDGKMSSTQRECEVCGVWTQTVAEVGPGLMEIHVLCDQHRNRETLATLVEVGDVMSSY